MTQDTNQTPELKPCPFCGEKAVLDVYPGEGDYTVHCQNRDSCCAQMSGYGHKMHVKNAWNTRTRTPAPGTGEACCVAARSAGLGEVEASDQGGPGDVYKYGEAVQLLRNLTGLARLGAAGLWKYESALKEAEDCIAQFDEDNGAPVGWPCGCTWHETTGFVLCDNCADDDAHKSPHSIKTPLEIFEGGDMNLKSSAGIRSYQFSAYSIRRIENALKPKAALTAPACDIGIQMSASTVPLDVAERMAAALDNMLGEFFYALERKPWDTLDERQQALYRALFSDDYPDGGIEEQKKAINAAREALAVFEQSRKAGGR